MPAYSKVPVTLGWTRPVWTRSPEGTSSRQLRTDWQSKRRFLFRWCGAWTNDTQIDSPPSKNGFGHAQSSREHLTIGSGDRGCRLRLSRGGVDDDPFHRRPNVNLAAAFANYVSY